MKKFDSSFPHGSHLDLWFDEKNPTFVVNPYNSVGFTGFHGVIEQNIPPLIAVMHGEFQTKSLCRIMINKSRATDTVVHDGAYTLFHSVLKGKFPTGTVQLQY